MYVCHVVLKMKYGQTDPTPLMHSLYAFCTNHTQKQHKLYFLTAEKQLRKTEVVLHCKWSSSHQLCTHPSLLVSTIPARSFTESELKFASQNSPRYFCTKSAAVMYFSPFRSTDAYYRKANKCSALVYWLSAHAMAQAQLYRKDINDLFRPLAQNQPCNMF